MKGVNLNYELEKFGKNKGLEYMKEAGYKVRSASERNLGKMKT